MLVKRTRILQAVSPAAQAGLKSISRAFMIGDFVSHHEHGTGIIDAITTWGRSAHSPHAIVLKWDGRRATPSRLLVQQFIVSVDSLQLRNKPVNYVRRTR